MNDTLHPALLPSGFRDILPPEAQIEAQIVERLMAVLGSHGFERVKPPLVEFETSLLDGPGAAMAQDTFRLMDPISQRMIGVRADMTLQIARIATTRLTKLPRPLRLSYAGQVLRVRGTQLRPERQFGQIGAELIGSESAAADAEMVSLAAEGLGAVGIFGLSVDLTLPPLVPQILSEMNVDAARAAALRAALDRKDAAAIDEIGGPVAGVLGRLMAAAGPAARALELMAQIALPSAAAAEMAWLAEIVGRITAANPDLSLTIDPVENRGFEYHTGVSFTIFARGIRGELGRGGRYLAGGDAGRDHVPAQRAARPPEPATGFTLYADTVIRAVPQAATALRVYLPHGTPRPVGQRLRIEGWITLAGLAPAAAPLDEARRLLCSHAWSDGAPVAL
ncbi:MAG: phosphoribosyltransferase regulatory subunit [Aliidongia sp.]|jgi:ATP phosphoribosyltransferase regulatory subunit|nr:phosphoribosyltransferase regulatory subunit [Aliidongia sp.]